MKRRLLQIVTLLCIALVCATASAAGGGHWTSWARRPWIPRDMPGNAMVLWLRADRGVTGTSQVTTWTDQSGAGNNATQSAGTTCPALVTGALNGLPVIRATAASSQRLNLSGVPLGSAITIAIVTSRTSTTSAYIVGGTGTLHSILSSATTAAFEWFNSGAAPDRQTFAAAAPGTHVLTMTQVDGSSLIGHFDGTAAFSATPTVANSGATVTRLFDASSDVVFHNGDIEEIEIYNVAAAAADLGVLDRYLKLRAGL